ncbi:hypothetical protein STANM309S_01459 [Streptomyces tanashiensis]
MTFLLMTVGPMLAAVLIVLRDPERLPPQPSERTFPTHPVQGLDALPPRAPHRVPHEIDEEGGGVGTRLQAPPPAQSDGSSAPASKPVCGPRRATATFSEAVRENEEVVPVNVLTWVLSSGVTVGR